MKSPTRAFLALLIALSCLFGCHPQQTVNAPGQGTVELPAPTHVFGSTVPFSSVVANGDLSGHYPGPSVAAITESGGPTSLTIGAITDGQIIKRSGSTVVGLALSSGTIALDASSAWPSITNGVSSIAQIESSTNHQNSFVLDFADGSTTYAEWATYLPGDYDGGSITAVVNWVANSASTNVVMYEFAGLCRTDGDAQDTAYGTAQSVTDANQGTNIENMSAATPAITLGGTACAAGKRVKFRLDRVGGDASDTLAATARVTSVKVSYTKAAP